MVTLNQYPYSESITAYTYIKSPSFDNEVETSEETLRIQTFPQNTFLKKYASETIY